MKCSRRAVAVATARVAKRLPAATGLFFGALWLGVGLLGAVPTALAQPASHPTTADGSTPAVPAGAASIRGRVVDAELPDATAGLDVILYALGADGVPGLARTDTGPDGRFSFTGISGEPGIVYLLGVRYLDVPYGQRVTFAPGQQQIDIELTVSTPSVNGDALVVEDSEIRIDWLGTRLAIQERHRVMNPGKAAVFVPSSARAGAAAPFEALLPPRAENFQTAQRSGATSFDRQGEKLAFWGPIYPGEQEIHYSYLVPALSGTDSLSLRARLPDGTGRLRVLAPTIGPGISSETMRAAEAVEIEGRSFAVLEAESLAAGSSIDIEVGVPDTTRNLDELRLDRSELTVELDDTVLEVSQRHDLVLAPGSHLAGSPTEPLLRFELPEGASLTGLGAGADRLGVRATDTSVDVFGPLGPGAHELAFRYRLPAEAGSTQIELRFPVEVPTLTLLVADTGLLIESDRLHRLRPRRLGTRTWLVREAFQIGPDETVSLGFSALSRAALPRTASMILVLAACTGAMILVVTPLGRRRDETVDSQEYAGTLRERELIYATIRDLDHDFETGKLAPDDHGPRRTELRARAVELLRAERSAPAAEGSTETPAPGSDAGARQTAAQSDGARSCSRCGGPTAAAWRFCPACGEALDASGAPPR